MPGVDRLVDRRGGRARRARSPALGIPAVHAVRHPRAQGRGGHRRVGRRGHRPARRRARSRRRIPTCSSSPTCACASTPSHGHCGLLTRRRRRRQRRVARAARAHRRVSLARAGADVGRAERHDGRARRRHPPRARRRGPQRRADHRLQREVRLRVLRPVPRGRRLGARVRRPPRLPDGSAPTATRRCARRCSTSRRAPTSSWSSRRCPTSTSSAPRQGRDEPAGRRVQRQRRVLRWSRPPPPPGHLDERAAVLETLTVDPPRRRRHRHHLPREGRRPSGFE